MDARHLKLLLDACFTAKKIIETLPAIPDDMKPRHFHVLDAIRSISYEKEICRVSDVSSYLQTTTPSISKLIRELEERKLIEKRSDQKDKRITYLNLTVEGQALVRQYVTDFHSNWAKNMKDISNKQAEDMVILMNRLFESMPEGGNKHE